MSTLVKTSSTPSEVEDSDPWKYIMLISGYFLHISISELLPFKFDARIRIDRDLELPGLPMMSMGILFMMQTKEVKVFSLRAVLIATLESGILR